MSVPAWDAMAPSKHDMCAVSITGHASRCSTCRALLKPPFKGCVHVQLMSGLLGNQIACLMSF